MGTFAASRKPSESWCWAACGFRNVSQIHHLAENARVKEFLKEKFQIAHIPCYFWLLTLLKMVKPDTLDCLLELDLL